MYDFSAKVWQYTGQGAWYFVTLPKEPADEIKMIYQGSTRGFGSVRVKATIGSTTWQTSIFPDSKSKSYVLPVKKEVRTAEGLQDGTECSVHLDILER